MIVDGEGLFGELVVQAHRPQAGLRRKGLDQLIAHLPLVQARFGHLVTKINRLLGRAAQQGAVIQAGHGEALGDARQRAPLAVRTHHDVVGLVQDVDEARQLLRRIFPIHIEVQLGRVQPAKSIIPIDAQRQAVVPVAFVGDAQPGQAHRSGARFQAQAQPVQVPAQHLDGRNELVQAGLVLGVGGRDEIRGGAFPITLRGFERHRQRLQARRQLIAGCRVDPDLCQGPIFLGHQVQRERCIQRVGRCAEGQRLLHQPCSLSRDGRQVDGDITAEGSRGGLVDAQVKKVSLVGTDLQRLVQFQHDAAPARIIAGGKLFHLLHLGHRRPR